MIRITRYLTILATATILNACSVLGLTNDVNNVKYGMSTSEVIQTAGKPTFVDFDPTSETWVYIIGTEDNRKAIRLCFINGRLESKTTIPWHHDHSGGHKK